MQDHYDVRLGTSFGTYFGTLHAKDWTLEKMIEYYDLGVSVQTLSRWINAPETVPVRKADTLLRRFDQSPVPLIRGAAHHIRHLLPLHYRRDGLAWLPTRRNGYEVADLIAPHLRASDKVTWLCSHLPLHVIPRKVRPDYLKAIEWKLGTHASSDAHDGFTMHHSAMQSLFETFETTGGGTSWYFIGYCDLFCLANRISPYTFLSATQVQLILGSLIDEIIESDRKKLVVLPSETIAAVASLQDIGEITTLAVGDSLNIREILVRDRAEESVKWEIHCNPVIPNAEQFEHPDRSCGLARELADGTQKMIAAGEWDPARQVPMIEDFMAAAEKSQPKIFSDMLASKWAELLQWLKSEGVTYEVR